MDFINVFVLFLSSNSIWSNHETAKIYIKVFHSIYEKFALATSLPYIVKYTLVQLLGQNHLSFLFPRFIKRQLWFLTCQTHFCVQAREMEEKENETPETNAEKESNQVCCLVFLFLCSCALLSHFLFWM